MDALNPKSSQPAAASFPVAKVITDVPKQDGIFDYAIPKQLQGKLHPGSLVAVPFGNDYLQGVVVDLCRTSDIKVLREILSLIDPEPVITSAQIALGRILADRTLTPFGICVNMLLPVKIRRCSYAEYRLGTGNPSAFSPSQPGLFSGGEEPGLTLEARILKYLAGREKRTGGGAPEENLRKAFPNEARRAVLNRLIASGAVIRELKFGDPAGAMLRKRENRSADADPTASPQVQTQVGSGLRMNEDQEKAVSAIVERLERVENGGRAGDPILIQGVTGSGKTEVYLRAAADALTRGLQVLMLVPEIALTHQIVQRFESRFPGLVGVYHSDLSENRRIDAWRGGRDGRIRIVIGTRSAFAVPLPELGLIIMDECHDESYSQSEGRPVFSASTLAIDYGRLTNAAVVYGSATPSVTQRYKAEQSHWTIVELPKRVGGAVPPSIQIVDLRNELREGNSSLFSRTLEEKLAKTLEAGRQSILFMNRRGSSSYVFCENCGMPFHCPNCDLNLTLHRATERMVCHVCGHKEDIPRVCPSCGSGEINRFSAGIEEVHALAAERFPTARILRLDSDAASSRDTAAKVLEAFAKGDADILIGTRMVSKGLDFPNVALVGVVLAEIGGGLLDYRVEEQIYQLMTQVIGRAGRSDRGGEAVLQTYQPDRYSIRLAVEGDSRAFYETELAVRRKMGYPPFSRLARILIVNREGEVAERDAYALANRLKSYLRAKGRTLQFIGPAPCFFSRLNGRFRWQILLRGARIVEAMRGFDLGKAVFEPDPVSVL